MIQALSEVRHNPHVHHLTRTQSSGMKFYLELKMGQEGHEELWVRVSIYFLSCLPSKTTGYESDTPPEFISHCVLNSIMLVLS